MLISATNKINCSYPGTNIVSRNNLHSESICRSGYDKIHFEGQRIPKLTVFARSRLNVMRNYARQKADDFVMMLNEKFTLYYEEIAEDSFRGFTTKFMDGSNRYRLQIKPDRSFTIDGINNSNSVKGSVVPLVENGQDIPINRNGKIKIKYLEIKDNGYWDQTISTRIFLSNSDSETMPGFIGYLLQAGNELVYFSTVNKLKGYVRTCRKGIRQKFIFNVRNGAVLESETLSRGSIKHPDAFDNVKWLLKDCDHTIRKWNISHPKKRRGND